jgi:hypothetical protein
VIAINFYSVKGTRKFENEELKSKKTRKITKIETKKVNLEAITTSTFEASDWSERPRARETPD